MSEAIYKIVKRDRVESSPKPGIRQAWTEYQIKLGRRIVARCGTEQEAVKRLARITREEGER